MNIFVILMAIGHGVLLGTGVIAIWTWTDEHLDKVRFKKRIHSATLEAIADEARTAKSKSSTGTRQRASARPQISASSSTKPYTRRKMNETTQ